MAKVEKKQSLFEQARRYWKELVWIQVCVVILIGIVIVWHQTQLSESTQSIDSYRSGLRTAPEFFLSDQSGKQHRLKDYQGKKIILHFWASWCAPCIQEIPQWIEFGSHLASIKNDSVQLIAISLDSSWAEAQKVWPEGTLPSNMISLIDPRLEVPERYGSYQFPESYLITSDVKGIRIFKKLVGPQNWEAPEIIQWVQSHSTE